jgi:hypothetical protein
MVARASLAFLLCSTLLCSPLALGCGKRSDGASGLDLDSTGVEECDAYVAKMAACIGKLPASARRGQEVTVQITRDVLEAKAEAGDDALEGAARAEARAALKAACRQMADGVADRSVCAP